jgi:hypothetical protein
LLRYGGLAIDYGIDDLVNQPKSGDMYKSANAMLWYNNSINYLEFVFINSTTASGKAIDTTLSVYTDRKVNVTYACEAHKITANGTGTSNYPEVEGLGPVWVNTVLPNSSVYFTNPNNFCEGSTRCSIVEVFEVSDTEPWYYKCNVTMGSTINDHQNISYISDDMAFTATSSIAQIGYTDITGQEYQIYPLNSVWGIPAGGDYTQVGDRVAIYALGSIAGASIFNPVKYYEGPAPTQAFALSLGHKYFFYVILGLICGFHLIFVVIVAIVANKVKVGPDAYLTMSLLLRPIAEGLEGVSGGKENKAYKDAVKNTTVRYEKSRSGRWILATST